MLLQSGLDGGIGRHSGLKIRRFVHSGRTGSIPVPGTIFCGTNFFALAAVAYYTNPMSTNTPPFEIHVHGDVPVRQDVSLAQLEEALRPLLSYSGAKTFVKGAVSAYEEEPGLRLDSKEHVLHMCWTVPANEDFRQALEEMCMGLNELASSGAAIEISIYDAEFDDEDEEEESDEESRDDFIMLFVGPTPGDIMQVQRDMLVEDVMALMERHFDRSEMQGVVTEVDKLFTQRFDALVSSLKSVARHVAPLVAVRAVVMVVDANHATCTNF